MTEVKELGGKFCERNQCCRGHLPGKILIVLRSVQTIRSKLSGGEKFIVMERVLYKKNRYWKILETNFDMTSSPPPNKLPALFLNL
ncbi:MAG TPA: hypothetical protein VKI61_00960 [Chitinophagaceae bacterium]|nr:hypothetical protein [Chitinophagaceae bacterium]